jgi:predicted membrane protein (TIGR00267 family)
MTPAHVQIERLREYLEIADVGGIARRYAAMNAFDGILTIIGVLMGAYTARVADPRIIISTGLGTSVAMGISGLWGAYLTETAERKHSLSELEKQTLSDLSQTRLGRASRVAVIVVALVDGLAPFLASLVVLAPFFLAALLPGPNEPYYIALGMAFAALFGLGAFLGTISRERLLVSGLKTICAGVVCVALNLLLGFD